jgi:hypothetical protein
LTGPRGYSYIHCVTDDDVLITRSRVATSLAADEDVSVASAVLSRRETERRVIDPRDIIRQRSTTNGGVVSACGSGGAGVRTHECVLTTCGQLLTGI